MSRFLFVLVCNWYRHWTYNTKTRCVIYTLEIRFENRQVNNFTIGIRTLEPLVWLTFETCWKLQNRIKTCSIDPADWSPLTKFTKPRKMAALITTARIINNKLRRKIWFFYSTLYLLLLLLWFSEYLQKLYHSNPTIVSSVLSNRKFWVSLFVLTRQIRDCQDKVSVNFVKEHWRKQYRVFKEYIFIENLPENPPFTDWNRMITWTY